MLSSKHWTSFIGQALRIATARTVMAIKMAGG